MDSSHRGPLHSLRSTPVSGRLRSTGRLMAMRASPRSRPRLPLASRQFCRWLPPLLRCRGLKTPPYKRWGRWPDITSTPQSTPCRTYLTAATSRAARTSLTRRCWYIRARWSCRCAVSSDLPASPSLTFHPMDAAILCPAVDDGSQGGYQLVRASHPLPPAHPRGWHSSRMPHGTPARLPRVRVYCHVCSWVVRGLPVAACFREDSARTTNNNSCFCPHYVEPSVVSAPSLEGTGEGADEVADPNAGPPCCPHRDFDLTPNQARALLRIYPDLRRPTPSLLGCLLT